jgi:hypothetical protein
MIYVSIGLGLLFFSMGFIITPSNAKYLLSGYNTMSSEDQEKFPIVEYLKAFKTFHIWFGILYTLLSVIFHLLDSDLVGYHLGITPILAYGYFFWTSRKYNEGLSSATKNNTTIGLIVLSLTLVFVVGLFFWSDRESSWTYENNQLEIQGPYSISLNISDLDSVSLLERLPEITIRSHGISTGKVAKGKFKGPNKARYHLLIDKPVGEVLALYPSGEMPVLISLDGMDERELFLTMQEDFKVSSHNMP